MLTHRMATMQRPWQSLRSLGALVLVSSVVTGNVLTHWRLCWCGISGVQRRLRWNQLQQLQWNFSQISTNCKVCSHIALQSQFRVHKYDQRLSVKTDLKTNDSLRISLLCPQKNEARIFSITLVNTNNIFMNLEDLFLSPLRTHCSRISTEASVILSPET